MGSIQNRVEDKWFYGSGDSMWILVGLVLVDATTPHRVLNAFLNGLQIVLLWFSLRILQIRLKMNLNNCLLQPSSYMDREKLRDFFLNSDNRLSVVHTSILSSAWLWNPA